MTLSFFTVTFQKMHHDVEMSELHSTLFWGKRSKYINVLFTLGLGDTTEISQHDTEPVYYLMHRSTIFIFRFTT